ncbi:hypothetical protein BDK51DRAFT_29640 [Blyttiomyces helicus]|uniref:Uncharacterized protein n=1 Tax=Blyttiomyces helicus TaxID=388810 RepID=A0A4P9WUB0_9FUNG|nr:hypothetical protein BDK51DRAFT_29640 [Blyttiomyces helicus]|eukprot:RKO94666.1 hypothetical protein BDK51DRAFT_29640 [Blyttiomyces helicus]
MKEKTNKASEKWRVMVTARRIWRCKVSARECRRGAGGKRGVQRVQCLWRVWEARWDQGRRERKKRVRWCRGQWARRGRAKHEPSLAIGFCICSRFGHLPPLTLVPANDDFEDSFAEGLSRLLSFLGLTASCAIALVGVHLGVFALVVVVEVLIKEVEVCRTRRVRNRQMDRYPTNTWTTATGAERNVRVNDQRAERRRRGGVRHRGERRGFDVGRGNNAGQRRGRGESSGLRRGDGSGRGGWGGTCPSRQPRAGCNSRHDSTGSPIPRPDQRISVHPVGRGGGGVHHRESPVSAAPIREVDIQRKTGADRYLFVRIARAWYYPTVSGWQADGNFAKSGRCLLKECELGGLDGWQNTVVSDCRVALHENLGKESKSSGQNSDRALQNSRHDRLAVGGGRLGSGNGDGLRGRKGIKNTNERSRLIRI